MEACGNKQGLWENHFEEGNGLKGAVEAAGDFDETPRLSTLLFQLKFQNKK